MVQTTAPTVVQRWMEVSTNEKEIEAKTQELDPKIVAEQKDLFKAQDHQKIQDFASCRLGSRNRKIRLAPPDRQAQKRKYLVNAQGSGNTKKHIPKHGVV